MSNSFAVLRSWGSGSRTTTPLKESNKENLSIPNSPASEKDTRAVKRIEAKKSQTRQHVTQPMWMAAVWAAIWVREFERRAAAKQRSKELKLEDQIGELKAAGIALNDQLTALKSSKKALQVKLARIEDELHAAEAQLSALTASTSEAATKSQQTIAALTEERNSLLETLAGMEQTRSAEQQAKTRQIYHHQEEMRAVRIEHERENAELKEMLAKLEASCAAEQQRAQALEAELVAVKENAERAEVNYERQITQMYRVYYDIDELKTCFLWSKVPVPLFFWEDEEKQAGEVEESLRRSFWAWLFGHK